MTVKNPFIDHYEDDPPGQRQSAVWVVFLSTTIVAVAFLVTFWFVKLLDWLFDTLCPYRKAATRKMKIVEVVSSGSGKNSIEKKED